jgi:hypothetical protein
MRRYIIYRIDVESDRPVTVVCHPRCDGGYEADDPYDALQQALDNDADESEPLFPVGVYLVVADVEDKDEGEPEEGATSTVPVRVFHDGALLNVAEGGLVIQQPYAIDITP